MLAMSQNLSENIAAAVNGIGRLTFGIDEEAASHGCIALYGSIGVIVGLRPDGTMWEFDADFDLPISPLARERQIPALVLGTRRYAWLAELLPERPVQAVDCSICENRGFLAPTKKLGVYRPGPTARESGILCPHCQGLGWLQI
jgi:hypothetical protein